MGSHGSGQLALHGYRVAQAGEIVPPQAPMCPSACVEVQVSVYPVQGSNTAIYQDIAFC